MIGFRSRVKISSALGERHRCDENKQTSIVMEHKLFGLTATKLRSAMVRVIWG